MRLFSIFCITPHPLPLVLSYRRYIADNCLAARMHMHMLDCDSLLAAGPVALKCFNLSCKSAGQFVEHSLGAVRLLDDVSAREAPDKCDGCHMNASHLRRQHAFNFIPWIDPPDGCQHEIERILIGHTSLPAGIAKLLAKAAKVGPRSGAARFHEQLHAKRRVGMISFQ